MYIKFFILINFITFLFSNSQFEFYADGELLEYKENGVTINKLTDNVRVFNDSLYLKTDQAYNYKELNTLYLYGNTEMISKTDTLICDSMIYWLDKDSLFAFGNVKLSQINQKLNTKNLYFWETNGYRGSSFIAEKGVTIIRGGKEIHAAKIQYKDNEQYMDLSGNAMILSGNRELFGNNINIQFNDSLISSINVNGDAKAHNIIYAKVKENDQSPKKLIDIMLGNNINVNFENNDVKNIILDRMASTTYHAIDSTLLIGINSVDGELINLHFNNDELNSINVKGDARGIFIPESENSKIDSVVVYKSNEIDYLIDTQESFLYKSGEIKYQNMILDANYIHVDWNKNTLRAIKKLDKLPTVITSDGEPMKGDSLTYNLLDKHGTIYKGKTKVDNAYYHGDQIYKDDPNLYHVISSEYTSCDLDHPHYSFYSNNMKMIPGDIIIARPLILKILDFPIIGIPFAILPNKGGDRHSGWIMPSFGFDNTNGSTMNGLGYYWAPNDYLDSKMIINFSDRIGFWFRNTINYKLRYKLDGKIDIKLVRKLNNTKYIESIITDSTTQQYEIAIKHNQTIDPSQKLNINYNYVSNYNFYENTSSDPLENIDKQQSKSSLVYSKSWSDWGNSMSFSISDITDLKKQEIISSQPIDTTSIIFPVVRNNFPSISFHHATSNLFGDGDKWYQALKWSISSQHTGYYKKGVYADHNYAWKDTTNYKNGISNQLAFAYPKQLFQWLNIATRMKIKEDWIFKYNKYDDNGDYSVKDGFRRRMTLGFSGTLNTKIYGIFPLNIKSLEAIRHTVTPTITISYTPNITKPILGYNLNSLFTNGGEFQFSDGKLYDPFYGSALSPTSEKEQLIYTFKIQNLFQTKHNDNGIKKNDVLDWDIKTSYNAFSDSLNWSSITSRMKSKIPGLSMINIDLTHDIYELKNGGRINKYANQINGIPIPSLTKLNATTSISLSGKRLIGFESDSLNNKNALTGQDNLWTTNLGLTYQKQKVFDYITDSLNWDETFQLNTSTTLNFSKKWKLSYRVGFDLIKQTMGWQSFTFTRNLHCWEFNFKWIPGKSYFLHIYVKNPTLRDIKLESRSKRDRNKFF